MLPRLLLLLLLALPAHAVIVRGRVTTALGRPLPGSRVQLVQLTGGARSVADAVSGLDGEYEMRTDLAGRFLLLTSSSLIARQAAAEIGEPFYAGRTDLLTLDVFLTPPALTPQLTAQTTLLSTPLAELSTATTQIAASQLLTHATLLPELRVIPGLTIVEAGPTGTPAFLYLRGASPAATQVLIDGASAEDLGGGFNLSTLSTSGLSAPLATPAVELTPVANPLFFLGAEAGVLAFESPRAATLHPTLTYSGDAGNLGALRNEAVATLAHARFDLLGSFARFDLSSERLPFHLATIAANLGYAVSANTGFRLTLRNDTAAAGLAGPFSFLPAFAIAPPGKQADQDLYSTFAFDTRTTSQWHNLARVAVVRKRAETLSFFNANTASSTVVTIAGANGTTATGLATFLNLPAREDRVTNREEYSYETDYPIPHLFTALFTARYQAERAADLLPPLSTRLARTHLSFAGGLQGELHHRLFYTASGFLDHSPLLGFRGAPRVGLLYVPVLPGARRFRGTSLQATVATGLREPSLAEQIASPGHPLTARARTFEASVNQSLFAQKLTLRATYFHNQFSHESETLSLVPFTVSQTLSLRTQGLESTLRYQPRSRLLLQGGYTYFAALVEQSATLPSFNPALPNLPGRVAIGALSALPGARPFHRPPHTGFFTAEYTGSALTATLKAAFSSRSDDSTNFDRNPALLLPNRDLSPGSTSLDASIAYAFTRHVTAFTQLTNLTGERHLAPVGYLSTPFLIRTGLRIRLGRE